MGSPGGGQFRQPRGTFLLIVEDFAESTRLYEAMVCTGLEGGQSCLFHSFRSLPFCCTSSSVSSHSLPECIVNCSVLCHELYENDLHDNGSFSTSFDERDLHLVLRRILGHLAGMCGQQNRVLEPVLGHFKMIEQEYKR